MTCPVCNNKITKKRHRHIPVQYCKCDKCGYWMERFVSSSKKFEGIHIDNFRQFIMFVLNIKRSAYYRLEKPEFKE